LPAALLEQKLQEAYARLYSSRSIKLRLSGHRGPHLPWARKVNQGYRLRTNKWLQRLGVDGMK